MRVLTVSNAKTVKGEELGWLTGVLHLAPFNLSGHQVCRHSTPACRAMCLNTAGRGQFAMVQRARIAKTQYLFNDRKAFIAELKHDIAALCRKAARLDMQPCIRLNGTSDLRWFSPYYGCIPQHFPDVVFYDYTKDYDVIKLASRKKLPPNYDIMLSYTGRNRRECRYALRNGINVAAVYSKLPPIGDKLWGYDVIDGDSHDLRFLDPRPAVVGLKAKGRARNLTNEMIIPSR